MNTKITVVAACLLIAMVPGASAQVPELPEDSSTYCSTSDGLVLYANCLGGFYVNWACETVFGPGACASDE